MLDALNVLLGGLLFYIVLMLLFIPLFKIGLFEFYMWRAKKSPQEILHFLDKAQISHTKEHLVMYFSVHTDKSEDYLEKRFGKFSAIQGLFNVAFGSFFVIACIIVYIMMSLQAIQSKDVVGAIIALLWLIYGLWCYGEALLFFQKLRKEDMRLKNLSLEEFGAKISRGESLD